MDSTLAHMILGMAQVIVVGSQAWLFKRSVKHGEMLAGLIADVRALQSNEIKHLNDRLNEIEKRLDAANN